MTVSLQALHNGSLALRDELCSFTTVRLKPSILLTTIRGVDTGRFGTEAFAPVVREHARFRKPVHWFIDARGAEGVTGGVLDTWTRWLAEQPVSLGRLDVLLSSRSLSVSVGVTLHLARASALMRIHHELPSFEAALRETNVSLTHAQPDPAPVSLEPERLPRGGFSMRAAQLSYRFQRTGANMVVTQVQGREDGQLGDAVVDAFDELLDGVGAPVHWRLDLRDVSYVSPARAHAWTAWLLAREKSFREIVVLASAPNVALFLLDSQYRFRRPDLMRIVRDERAFDEGCAAPQGS